jgi:multiple sugar transport system substrate-binding protein
MKPIIDEFEAKNPNIKVTYEQKSHKDYRERLQNAINGGNGPDAFRYHHTWVPMLSNTLATIPSDIFPTGDYQQTFYPIAYDWLRSSSGLVGVPLMVDGLGLYYNKEILSAAGKSAPTTWDELRRTAKQVAIKQEETILRGGVALGTTSNVDHWPDIVGLMLLQNSADPEKPNNKQGQDAITFYTLFNTVDHVWDETMPESTLAFATEKVVMMIAPSWRAHDVHNYNPELDFAIAPAPTLPDTDITWASFWAEGVSSKSNSKKQEAAWKLIAFMAEKENMRKFYQQASDAPGRLFGEPFSRVDLADQLSGDPLVGAYINQMTSAKSWFLSSRTWDNGLNDKIIKYYEDAINLVLEGEDADEVLVTTEQGISQVYSQFGI